MTAAPHSRAYTRLRRSALLSATMLATFVTLPAEAAMYGIVVNQVQDPLFSNLTIPDAAPSVGMWSNVYDWPMNAIHLSLMPNGKIVSYGSPGGNPGMQDGRTFDVWDPTQAIQNGHKTLPGVTGINSFCAAQAFQADGSLLISGGIFDNNNDKGSLTLGNATNGVTAISAKLANDRYYSTMITLADGRQLIMGGSYPYLGGYADPQGSIDKGYMTGMTPEIFANGAWSSLFGAKSREAFGPDNSRWWYPRAWVAPSGKVFGLSSDQMWTLDPANGGSVTAKFFRDAPRQASSWADAPNTGPASTAVMYDVGKILQVGGNSFDNGNGYWSSNRATVFDINGSAPTVTDTANMTWGRTWANATVLPTGTVTVTGGSSYNDRAGESAIYGAESWDPKTGKWTRGPDAAIYRGYHSSAILLQNGAIMVAGGGAPGPVANQNAEVYYPPYLFTTVNGKAALAPRPQIVSLSTNRLVHAQSMQFELSSQNGLSQVVLVGLSGTTHSFNTTQRRFPAAFTVAGRAVTVQTPASGSVAPPGYYQLVAIDKNGVPSPGIIVGLGGVAAPVQATTLVAAGGTASNGSGGSTGGTGTGTTGTGTAGTVPTWPTSTASWNQIGVTVKRIAAGADGTILVNNSNDKSLWLNNGNGNWTQLQGTANDVAIVSAKSLYRVGQDNYVYRSDTNGQSWNNVGRDSVTISAAADGTVAVTNIRNELWVKRADNNVEDWYQIPVQAKRVAVMNNSTFYYIGTDNNVYRTGPTGNWARVGADASDISASSDGSVMVVNKNNGTLWRKNADNNVEAWTQQPTNQPAIAVAIPSAKRVVMVGQDTNIYRY